MDKPNYKNFLAELRKILNRHDPIGLIGIGVPEDEYDPERSVIASRLVHCHGVEDVHAMVYEVFCEYFGAKIAGARAAYGPLAECLWDTSAKWIGTSS